MTELPVQVTILGEKPKRFESSVVRLEKRMLSVRARVRLPLLTLLKIETGEQLWMGEVIECRPDGEGWIASIELRHALRDLTGLARLAERFTGSPRVEQGEPEAAPVRR